MGRPGRQENFRTQEVKWNDYSVREGSMTLGIGVLCDHGETFVLGSEQRASYGTTGTVPVGQMMSGKQFISNPTEFSLVLPAL